MLLTIIRLALSLYLLSISSEYQSFFCLLDSLPLFQDGPVQLPVRPSLFVSAALHKSNHHIFFIMFHSSTSSVSLATTCVKGLKYPSDLKQDSSERYHCIHVAVCFVYNPICRVVFIHQYICIVDENTINRKLITISFAGFVLIYFQSKIIFKTYACARIVFC